LRERAAVSKAPCGRTPLLEQRIRHNQGRVSCAASRTVGASGCRHLVGCGGGLPCRTPTCPYRRVGCWPWDFPSCQLAENLGFSRGTPRRCGRLVEAIGAKAVSRLAARGAPRRWHAAGLLTKKSCRRRQASATSSQRPPPYFTVSTRQSNSTAI
jgi:hypothetical protein